MWPNNQYQTVGAISVFFRNLSATGVELWHQRRSEGRRFKGLLEFPGGKLDPGESPIQAVKREVFEEVHINVPSSEFNFLFVHVRQAQLILYVFISSHIQDLPEEYWLKFRFGQTNFSEYPLLNFNDDLIQKVLKALEEWQQ